MAKKSSLLTDPSPRTLYTAEDIQTLYDYPHILGWICGKPDLSEVHSEWIWYLWDPLVTDHRALRAHRGSYKTTALGVIAPIWWWLFHDPDSRIFIIQKDFTKAANIVETVHAIMQTPEVMSLFEYVHGIVPKAKIKRKELISYNFKRNFTPEGSINAFGLDGGLVGKHGDKLYCDDFTTIKDRLSAAEREWTKQILMDIMTNIVDPGKSVALSGTPWHRDDAWTICPTPRDYSVYDLDILTPEEIEKKRRTTTSSLWAANYELKFISDDSALFREPVREEWRQKGIDPPRAHLDAAFDGDHYCALTIMARRMDGKLQARGWTYAGNVKTWKHEVSMLCKRFGVKKLYIEDNPDKGYTADDLRSEGLPVQTYTETMNKDIKISTFLLEAWPDIVWDPGTDDEYLNQIIDYRERQEPNDAPDSAASLVRACYAKHKLARSERWKW